MSSNSGSNLYSQGFGTTSSNSFPGNAVIFNRPPSSGDIRGSQGMYSIGQLWVDESTSSSWQLMSFSSSLGTVSANWTVLGGASSDVNTLSGDTGTAVPVGGDIQIAGSGPISTAASGNTVAISFTPGASVVSTLTGNSGGAVAPTAGNINVVGAGALAIAGSGSTLTGTITPGALLVAALHPDSGGDVSPTAGVINIAGGAGVTTTGSGSTLTIALAGGGLAVDSFAVQTGTTPITPTAGGLITLNGAVVAAGTNPVRTDGTAASTIAVEVQTSQAIAATDATKIGLAAFNSASFTVDANGFVSLSGGGLAIDSLVPNSGTTPVVPDGTGSITFQGTGSITTVGGLNSITPQLTGLTNHNVLVGAGTATITNVAPGTAGIPLVSVGVAADPSFSTALVVGGGTGSVSFNAYGPVVAGATTTTALSSVTPNSTVGIPFVSQGASANPAFATAVVAGGGTGSTSFNTYGPLVAAATATGAIISVSPSATIGIPFVSAGASANPTFGTSVVAGGGTGVTSLVVYAPVCGGTTTTGAVQSADTGISTSGFVLTSTGAASLPTWQAAADASSIHTITGNSGGPESPSAGNFNILGTGSVTVSGTANTETVSLTGLTNHAVLVGAGTATITNVGPTATAGQILQSAGSSADPAFSTATYPATTTINQILYSSSANVVGGISAVNNSVMTGGATGIPAFTALASNGQLIIGSGAGAPAAATLTAGPGISVTNGANSITITATGSGFGWADTSGTFTAAAGNGYFISGASTATLPASPSNGDSVAFVCDTASALVITGNTSQIIRIGSGASSAAGTATSTAIGDSITLVYRVADTTWISLGAPQGIFTLA